MCGGTSYGQTSNPSVAWKKWINDDDDEWRKWMFFQNR